MVLPKAPNPVAGLMKDGDEEEVNADTGWFARWSGGSGSGDGMPNMPMLDDRPSLDEGVPKESPPRLSPDTSVISDSAGTAAGPDAWFDWPNPRVG